MNWKTVFKSFKNKDMQKRLFGVIGLIVIFRFLSHIPVPLAEPTKLKEVVANAINSTDLGGFINLLTGGALTSSTPLKCNPCFNILSVLAPNITGIAIRNENSVATDLEKPDKTPPSIVDPLLEVPGINDST